MVRTPTRSEARSKPTGKPHSWCAAAGRLCGSWPGSLCIPPALHAAGRTRDGTPCTMRQRWCCHTTQDGIPCKLMPPVRCSCHAHMFGSRWTRSPRLLSEIPRDKHCRHPLCCWCGNRCGTTPQRRSRTHDMSPRQHRQRVRLRTSCSWRVAASTRHNGRPGTMCNAPGRFPCISLPRTCRKRCHCAPCDGTPLGTRCMRCARRMAGQSRLGRTCRSAGLREAQRSDSVSVWRVIVALLPLINNCACETVAHRIKAVVRLR